MAGHGQTVGRLSVGFGSSGGTVRKEENLAVVDELLARGFVDQNGELALPGLFVLHARGAVPASLDTHAKHCRGIGSASGSALAMIDGQSQRALLFNYPA
jgi:hypothetical protein